VSWRCLHRKEAWGTVGEIYAQLDRGTDSRRPPWARCTLAAQRMARRCGEACKRPGLREQITLDLLHRAQHRQLGLNRKRQLIPQRPVARSTSRHAGVREMGLSPRSGECRSLRQGSHQHNPASPCRPIYRQATSRRRADDWNGLMGSSSTNLKGVERPSASTP